MVIIGIIRHWLQILYFVIKGNRMCYICAIILTLILLDCTIAVVS